ncbi:MAG: hypothetical protein GX921_09565 [Bacteroidales bacterium]|nr:hypothetical protein [Bacteroidales bacterium]
MNNLTLRSLELQRMAHQLMYFDGDEEPTYSDTLSRLNEDVLADSDALFPLKGADAEEEEEEANLCLALLMGYNATERLMCLVVLNCKNYLHIGSNVGVCHATVYLMGRQIIPLYFL